jgi:hypothetical protein
MRARFFSGQIKNDGMNDKRRKEELAFLFAPFV